MAGIVVLIDKNVNKYRTLIYVNKYTMHEKTKRLKIFNVSSRDLPVEVRHNNVISHINMNKSMSVGWNKKTINTQKPVHFWQLKKESGTININFAQCTWAILWPPFLKWFFEAVYRCLLFNFIRKNIPCFRS